MGQGGAVGDGGPAVKWSDPFADLPRGHFGAILADPPWHFEAWASPPYGKGRLAESHYPTMQEGELAALPVGDFAAPDCILFMWTCWPRIEQAFRLIESWGFKFKTCGFCWVKADATQIEMFDKEIPADMLLGYWTRSNSEVCLLATRGKPKRLNADVRQGIIAPRREHSRKPDGIHERIERLVAGPYLELFARQKRPGWTVWGNETDKFKPAESEPELELEYDAAKDVEGSFNDAYAAIRERMAAGGPGWEPKA
jgi:N6-adenosine-specific RNA methylase IME4